MLGLAAFPGARPPRGGSRSTMRLRCILMFPAVAAFLLLLNHLGWPQHRGGLLHAEQALSLAPQLPADSMPVRNVVMASVVSSHATHHAQDALRPTGVVLRDICKDTEEFAAGAPQLNMTVVVFAWRRQASLQRLVQSLQQAQYCDHRVPLKLFLEGGALPSVRHYLEGIEWRFGPKTLHAYDDAKRVGIRGMWINSTSACAPLAAPCTHARPRPACGARTAAHA